MLENWTTNVSAKPVNNKHSAIVKTAFCLPASAKIKLSLITHFWKKKQFEIMSLRWQIILLIWDFLEVLFWQDVMAVKRLCMSTTQVHTTDLFNQGSTQSWLHVHNIYAIYALQPLNVQMIGYVNSRTHNRMPSQHLARLLALLCPRNPYGFLAALQTSSTNLRD